MRIHLLAALLFLTLAPSAAAQAPTAPSWTFGATAGFARTWDDEGSIGNGWLLGGYADRRLSRNVDLELAADVVRNERADSFVTDGTTTYLSAQVIRRFGPRRSNCFIMAGPALALYKGETGFSDGSFKTERSSVNPGLIFGGGLSFRTGNDIEIAPIIRITLMRIDTDSDPWSAFTYGLRVGFGR